MRRHWRLVHRSSDLYESEWVVALSEEPAWAHLAESVWNGLCVATRGWIGGHGQSRLYNAVVWRVPAGRPKWDRSVPEDPWLENSLGSVLHRLESWMLTRSDVHMNEIVEIPITADVARQIDGEFVEDVRDLDDEAPGAGLAAEVRRGQ